MQNTLEENSGILLIKSKFFLVRLVSYFSFLLIPILLPKSLELDQITLIAMMALYILFMVSQWFLLGKEIDHRLKIYFRVNSSIDRVVYRLFMGMTFFIVYFNLLAFLPSKWIYNSFWITWVGLGLFYSWPTRGKLIKESVTTNFGEFRYLDRFEKTLVGLVLLLFIFSIPDLPSLTNQDALKLFFDPLEKFSNQFWNFLTVNYYPFKKYPRLFKLAWSMHFYVVGLGFFLLTLYALLRFFVSRRLSLLGVFALLSSWSFSKILASNYGDAITTTYSLIWVWSLLWVVKSSTYRAGLFLGLINYWGAVINQPYSLLIFVQLGLLYGVLLKDKTIWFRKQLIKYSLWGLGLTLIVLITHLDSFENLQNLNIHFIGNISQILDRKAFFSLSIFGLGILIWKSIYPEKPLSKNFKFDMERVRDLGLSLLILLLFSTVFDSYLVKSFALMWPITVLSLVPIELLFQTISRLRSSRNMIYLIYILICLLDSHFEGRVKIFIRLFDS